LCYPLLRVKIILLKKEANLTGKDILVGVRPANKDIIEDANKSRIFLKDKVLRNINLI